MADETAESGHARLVVLLHGLGRTPGSMARIAEAIDDGSRVLNFGYPSLTREVPGIARSLADALAVARESRIDFVTHSMGAIVLRELLANGPHHWRDGRSVRRVVMIAPPNAGSATARMVPVPDGGGAFGTLRRLGDPSPAPGWTGEAESLTVIAGARGRDMGFNPLLDGDDDGTVRVEETRLPGMDRHVLVGPEDVGVRKLAALHSWLPGHERVVGEVRRALGLAARSGWATGRDIVRDLGRPGPPSEVASRPRRRVFQPRRRLDRSKGDAER